MKSLLNFAFLVISFAPSTGAFAQNIHADQLRKLADTFLREQTAAMQDEVRITVQPLDARLKLSACENASPFLTPGSKAWGKIMLGIRCTTPKPWTVYLAAHVQVFGDYFAIKAAVSQGQILNAEDLIKVSGELSSLASGTIRQASLAIGKTMQTSHPAGIGLKFEMFKVLPAIQQGQTVKMTRTGAGFSASNEAVAINNANEGQLVKARTLSGQILSGIARADGRMEIQQ